MTRNCGGWWALREGGSSCSCWTSLAYVPLSPAEAELLFQVLDERAESRRLGRAAHDRAWEQAPQRPPKMPASRSPPVRRRCWQRSGAPAALPTTLPTLTTWSADSSPSERRYQATAKPFEWKFHPQRPTRPHEATPREAGPSPSSISHARDPEYAGELTGQTTKLSVGGESRQSPDAWRGGVRSSRQGVDSGRPCQ